MIISQMRELLKPSIFHLSVPIGKLLMTLHSSGTDGERVAQKFQKQIERYVRRK